MKVKRSSLKSKPIYYEIYCQGRILAREEKITSPLRIKLDLTHVICLLI